jgi:predicted Zn-dependent protease
VFDNYLSTEGIERTVLVHETGHLLGLDHEDNPGCVMTGTLYENASVRSGRISPPDDYCAKDVQQLERMRYYLF